MMLTNKLIHYAQRRRKRTVCTNNYSSSRAELDLLG